MNNQKMLDVVTMIANIILPDKCDHESAVEIWLRAMQRKAREALESCERDAAGNTEAMREALEFCARQMSDAICSKDFGDDVVYLVGCMKTCIEHMKAALSASPRNCDVMDWRTAWAKWRTENHPQKPVGYSECYESTTMFMDWYTGTEERKGEGDGSK